MKLTNTKLSAIRHKALELNNGKCLHLELLDSIGGAMVFHQNFSVCSLSDITLMIEELTILRDAVQEETGIVIE